MQREVLDRAGLRHTGFWPRCFRGARVAPLSRPPRGARARENWGFKGSDGICSTAADLAAFMRAVASGRVTAHPELLFERKVALVDGFAGRGFFISRNGTVWTRGTEDYGHNGVVKLLPDGTVLVALSDVPALRREDVPQSRAMGDLLEQRHLERRGATPKRPR
jgi:CubicO group peptidase (beta-lactamase class C family)